MQSIEQSDLAALDVIPAHRHLGNAVTAAEGDIKHFSIEAEAFQSLARKYLFRHVGAEQLEAALRVRDGQPGDGAHDNIEETPNRFAIARLVNPNQGPVDSARTDGDFIIPLHVARRAALDPAI